MTDPAPPRRPLLVASHNLMHGLGIDALIADYQRLRADRGLDVLCVQENVATGERTHAHRIAAALGGDYEVVIDDAHPALALICDRRRLRGAVAQLIELPRLTHLRWFERLYIAGGRVTPKHALAADLRTLDGERFTVATFHLDTAGTNAHRRAQVAAIARALQAREGATRLVACGDTNVFALMPAAQRAALTDVTRPLADLGAHDPETRPTHFFARQDEPKLTHQLAVRLGRLGLDYPLRYDVMCTNLPVVARGQLTTPASDHDLVWVAVAVAVAVAPVAASTP